MRVCRRVGRHCGADKLFEGGFVDFFAFAEIDRAQRVPFQAGIEELVRDFDRGSEFLGKCVIPSMAGGDRIALQDPNRREIIVGLQWYNPSNQLLWLS